MSNGFLGQDWSWANLKGKGQGILNDPSSLTTNPWFNMGMGVLSANQSGGDPWSAMAGALQTTKQRKQEDEDRKRIEELRAQIAALIRQQMLGRQTQVDPQTGAMSTPLPQAQQPPRSIMDLYRGGGGLLE